ncbi:hypothetical protein V6N13_035280 [Hibiscus sabdariffa]
MEPFPSSAFKFSFEYLLLPPRSAPTAAPPGLTPRVLRRPPRPPTHRGLALAPTAGYRTPWSVFQDGPDGEPAGRRPEHAGAEARRDGACWVPRSRRRRLHGRIKGPGLGRHHDPRRSTPRADRRTGSRRSTSDRGASPAPIRFPPDNFKHSLTLFSKSFSSFPRGTCSLSVSRPYLALDGIYRPIRAAFPNNPTRRQRLVVRQGPGTTGLSPSPAPLSRGLGPGPSLRTLLQDYNSDAEGDRFSSWAIPGSLAVTKGILAGFDNDPSAGSPTETLLRLLLPLNDKVQWTSRDVAGSEPPTSPRSEHFTGPFNRNLNDASPAQGPCDPSSYHESSEQRAKPASTFYLINASLPEVGDQPGSIPSRRPSRMVLNTLPRQGRGHNEARASFVSRDKMHKLRANRGLDPTLTRYSASESTIEHRCTDVVESCRSTHSGHRARLRSTKQPQGHLTDKGWQYIQNSIDLGTQHRIPIAPLGLDDHKGRTLKSSAARQFDA